MNVRVSRSSSQSRKKTMGFNRKEYKRLYRQRNKEKIIAYRQKNKEKTAAYDKEYRQRNKERLNARRKEYNHKKGICRRYWGEGIPKRMHTKIYKALIKGGGPLTIQTIQLVYEDNIKHYGTLTCIYCINPITFGKDTLEHKQPLSRGGTNEYKNLGIACARCNSSKRNKTEEEYRKTISLEAGVFNVSF